MCGWYASIRDDVLWQLTDTAVVELSSCCHGIRALDLSHLCYITDTALVSVGKHCTNLTSLNIEGRCENFKLKHHSASLLVQRWHLLHQLKLYGVHRTC